MKFRSILFVAIALCLISFATVANAQNALTLTFPPSGTYGYSGVPMPTYEWYSTWYCQYQITPADIAAAGCPNSGPLLLTSISFYMYSNLPVMSVYGLPMNIDNFSIYMKNSAPSNMSSFDQVGRTQVFGPEMVNYQTFLDPNGSFTAGWKTYNFSQPFQWDGVSNIIIGVCGQVTPQGCVNYAYQSSAYYAAYNTSIVRSRYVYTDGYCAMCDDPNALGYGYTTYYIPHMRFGYAGLGTNQFAINAPSFINLPSSLPVNYTVGDPNNPTPFPATLTFNLYDTEGQLVYSEMTAVTIPAGPALLSGQYNVNTASLAPGFYFLEVVYSGFTDACNMIGSYPQKAGLVMVLPAGMVPCIVWPGDANRDDLVNWADRNALHKYILDADLDPMWLEGPPRFRGDAATNPLSRYTWEAQPAVPWATPDGCYMDTDGNGVVNSFDYLPIKINWMKTTDTYSFTKERGALNPGTFDMEQNHPNPFNPSTTIRYSVPEASLVTLTVTDMLGRTVATLVNGRIEQGIQSVSFSGTGLVSGSYSATVNMTGIESGLTFTKTIRMAVAK